MSGVKSHSLEKRLEEGAKVGLPKMLTALELLGARGRPPDQKRYGGADILD